MAIHRYNLNLAGEYRAAKLLKFGLFATMTYGNKKGAGIYAIGNNQSCAILRPNEGHVIRTGDLA